MATMVCRGLQSCLDSHLVEQRTFLLLKFSQPRFEIPLKPSFPDDKYDIQEINAAPHGVSGDWASLQSLSTATATSPRPENIYVHPLSKRSNSTSLSEKSLELCTENLGNETGADIIENNIFSPEAGDGNLKREQKMSKKVNSQKFPPPLTMMREMECFRVKPHRQEGRLIIEAVKTPARKACFEADRSHGRLRLSFSKTEEIDYDDEEEEKEE